jgi:hypothetical protein
MARSLRVRVAVTTTLLRPVVGESAPTVLEFLRILRLLPEAEAYRRFCGPSTSVARFRSRGLLRQRRSPAQRRRLRRLIHALDRRLPDGGNCLRRAFVEIALDRGAAAERLHFGLVRNGGPRSGHAWLESDAPAKMAYDAVFTL